MRRALIIALAALVSLFTMPAVAQEAKRLINIDQSSFRPVQTGALSGVGIDKIGLDRSKRPCARIKMHVNRMTREEIDGLTVRPIGGMVELTKKSTAVEGNGLIFEITAKEQVRFYLHHDIYGDSNEVTVNLEANKEYYLNAQLDQLFTITVASNMKDADVYIDNRYCNKTNEEYILIVHDITPGEHALRIEHAGRKAEQKILVHRDNVYFRCNVDTAEASPQYVVFEVEPANAMVFIDNEPQTTQEGFVQTVLQNGSYSWRVMAKGYHEQSGTFTVSGAKVTRKVTLKADAAMVTISAGGGADIWVNNERKGNSSWRGMLSSGTYIFEARKEGHRTTRLTQTITSATAEQSYTLDAPTPIMGRLDVSCVPAIADLYVDGKKIGETPLTTSLLVGEHSVELRRSGYTSQSQKVSVSEGKTATVNVTLAKVATAAASTSSAGISTAVNGQPAQGSYKVGDYYNENGKEGVVFWVDASGEHGKIISLTESKTALQWASVKSEQERLIGADDKENGANNMAKVQQIYEWQSKYPAFKWCADLGEGWYLPAIEELKLFTLDNTVRNAINQTLATKGGTKIPDIGTYHWYWSSTERNEKYREEFCVWHVFMDDGGAYNIPKNESSYVRAVSAFGNKSQAEATTTATYADSATANFDGFEMVFVKGGTFTMGATAEQGSYAYDDEKPAHSVTVSDFYIGKYEVTQAQWEAVMGKNLSRFKGNIRPVENVSWNDIQEFIEKLNAKTGKKYRLPTEAEWEYAARGGNQSKGYKYSGSNNIDEVAWYTNNSGTQTHPVGQKQPNELGLYDMSGNVFEWCSDWYGSYSSGSQTNPTGPANGSRRVVRGGCCCDIARSCRVSNHYKDYPSYRSSYVGFRLACQP